MDGIDKELVEYFSSIGKGFGMHDLMLKIFAVLFIEPDEIAMEDIAKKTGYSLASISNTMKMLESIGFVERRKRPKSKKVYFYMGKDIIRWNISKIIYASQNMINPAKERLPGIIKEYKGKAKNEKDKKKISIVQDYYDQILVFEKIIDGWKNDLEKIIR